MTWLKFFYHITFFYLTVLIFLEFSACLLNLEALEKLPLLSGYCKQLFLIPCWLDFIFGPIRKTNMQGNERNGLRKMRQIFFKHFVYSMFYRVNNVPSYFPDLRFEKNTK